MDREIIQFCDRLGRNKLLVQGAGGNISWKDNDILYVKASGAWLADAAVSNIFTKVDLESIRRNVFSGCFDLGIQGEGGADARPSIETLLHAIMPQAVVLHLHAIDVLSVLVRDDAISVIQELMDPGINWAWVPYYRPGPDLAAAVLGTIVAEPLLDVVFLQNHGLVLGADSVADIECLLDKVNAVFSSFSKKHFHVVADSSCAPSDLIGGYTLHSDAEVRNMALDNYFFKRLNSTWRLYPDHVVFLGPAALCFDNFSDFKEACPSISVDNMSPIFVYGYGVYVKETFTRAQYAQLRCYFDVLSRLDGVTNIQQLDEDEVFFLCGWDLEKYRVSRCGSGFDGS